MGRKCSVKDCLSDTQRKEDIGVTFHKVPLHVDIRPKWLQLCQITDEKKCIYVCSRHFLRADFCNFKGRKYLLKQGVLPSIFPWNKPAAAPKEEKETEDDEVVIKTESESDPPPKSINEVIESSFMQPLHIKTEPLDIKEEITSPSNSSTIEQKLSTVNTSTGELAFVPDARIEALDFNQTWRPATILEVDYEENEVLVHFDMYSSKYDEWIGINSNSIRAVPAVGVKNGEEIFAEGERCMASWSDARKFPATVKKVLDSNTYEVLFDDGYVKTLKSHRMSKPSSTSPQCSPLFQPVSSTKEERRTKKRKLDVTTLFSKKRPKMEPEENAVEVKVEDLESPVEAKVKTEIAEEWYPTWENNRPVGVDSFVSMVDGQRKSVIVADPRLPPKWEKHMTQRIHGTSAGKWGIIIVSPEGKKFRQKCDIRQYIKDNPQLHLHESMFEFILYKNRRKPQQVPPAELPTPEVNVNAITPEPPPVQEKKSNTLKINCIDGGYKCPIDHCGKNFRRENLAQMHVKHYHPEYTKFLDSTPNVADLAYARTAMGETSKSPGGSAINADRVVRDNTRISRPKPATPKTPKPEPIDVVNEPQKDSEILKLLNSKPFDSISKIESSSVQPLPSGLPPSMYPDIKLKDLLVKSEAVPKSNDINLKSLSSATTRPTGIKTLLPVKKDDHDLKATPSKPSRKDTKRKRLVSEVVEMQRSQEAAAKLELPTPATSEIKPEYIPPEQPENIIIEGGEVIKIVRMRQEEIINCTCGITEEDGLMIQCELCFCWQHAYCNNIQKENEVPEKYVCYICQHPAKQRESMKYLHDQDWLKHGTLPSCSFRARDEEAEKGLFEKLKVSHDISGGLVELKDYVHSLKLKIKIAEIKNHPKLYLWSKPWDKIPLPENANHLKTEETIKQEDTQSESMLMSILKAGKDYEDGKLKEELPEFPKIDINTLIDSNMETMAPTTSNIPQPEAPIESADCRLNLLEHIIHCQQLVEERLSSFEKQLNDLDPTLFEEEDDHFAKVKMTTAMVTRDLNTLKELADLPAI